MSSPFTGQNNISWLISGQRASGSTGVPAPSGVLNQPLWELWQNTDYLKEKTDLMDDVFEELLLGVGLALPVTMEKVLLANLIYSTCGSNFVEASGSLPDIYLVERPVGLDLPVPSITPDGMVIIVNLNATNATTTPALSITTLVDVKTIVLSNGSALSIGQLPAGKDICLRFNASLDQWTLQYIAP